MSGLVNDYELIKQIESYPILYDKNLVRGQKSAFMKDEAWKQISKTLNASERACITRWKSLRDRFGKEYRRVQENPLEPTCWEMFPHLMFLIDHYKYGKTKNEPIITIRYEPKMHNEKSKIRTPAYCEPNNEGETDPNELIANQELIEIVKQYPVLYDKQQIRDSKNVTAKNAAWIEISQVLGSSEQNCFNRWKKLRTKFAHELHKHKLYPEKPIKWIYFQDLSFLEDHYRKGIPLNIDNLKRRPKTEEINTQPFGSDYFECIEEDPGMPYSEVEYKEQERNQQDIILMPFSQPHKEDEQFVELSVENVDADDEPEQKLNSVITNMENVLKQSKDCLKSLQQQNLQHKQEQQQSTSELAGILRKVQNHLSDLPPNERIKAERKILQFLCECQIKTLNNEEVDDLCSELIY